MRRVVSIIGGTALVAGVLVTAPATATATPVAPNAPTGAAPAAGRVSDRADAATTQQAGTFVPLSPARVLDTRTSSAVAAKGTRTLAILGHGGVPASNVSAVVLNVTVTKPTASGYLTVYGSAPRPTASNLNFVAGKTVPNLVFAPVGSDGSVRFYNGSAGTVQVIADVSGYFVGGSPSVAGALKSLAPTRVLDTRTGSAVPAKGTQSLAILGHGGVPASNVSAVVLNVTVTKPATSGYLTVYGSGARPTTSNLNFVTGQTVPNLVVAPVGTDGKVRFYNGAGGTTQVIADVSGYFIAGQASVPGAFVSLTPARLVDTRKTTPVSNLAAKSTLHLPAAGHGGLPTSGVSALQLNVTVAAPTGSGYVTVYGDTTTPRPSTSNVNFSKGQVVPNAVVSPIGTNGRVAFYNGSAGTTPLIADASGYYVGVDVSPPGPVTAATATATGTTSIALSWTNPTDADFAGVVVRRNTGTAAPTSPTGGTAVTSTTGSTHTVTDSGLTPGTRYTYALFAHDAVPNYATAATATATTTAAATTGAIGGTVTAAANGAGLAGVVAKAYSGGSVVGSATTTAAGTYTISSLPAGSYVVCLDAASATGGPSTSGYDSQCFDGVPWNRGALPGGTTAVTVTAGATRSGVNAALGATGTGSIAGTVTGATGGGAVSGVKVLAFDLADGGVSTAFSSATTSATGAYKITGLAASSPGYAVCFDASTATGASATGYLDRCYKDVAWNGRTTDPRGATPVPVAAGQAVTAINQPLLSATGLSGKVTSGTTGLSGVNVLVFSVASGDLATGFASASTAADGTYTVRGLPPDPDGVNVCFDGSHASGGASTTGYLSQCYHNVAWDGVSAVPAAAAVVPVPSPGAFATNINADLSAGGALSGTVTASAGGGALKGVVVQVYDSGGDYVTDATTDVSGKYTVAGLPTSSGYRVCFDAAKATGGTSASGYLDACYQNAAWDGSDSPPNSAKPVSVTAGSVTTGISIALGNGAAIGGTVKAGTTGLGAVAAIVYDQDGDELARAVTASGTGAYTVTGLAPKKGPFVVCFDAATATGGAATGGYVDECYDGVPWRGEDNDGYTDLPDGVTPVTVTADSVTTVNATLDAAASIAGTVTGGAGGVGDVDVTAYVPPTSADDYPSRAAETTTAANGTYRLTGLPASASGYVVCFGAYDATGSSPGGYLSQCYNGRAWDGDDGNLPSGVTPVTLTAGQARTGIDAVLSAAGAISGRVTAADGGTALHDVDVEAFSADGDYLTDTYTGSDGRYLLAGLPPGDVTVCFYAYDQAGGSSPSGYLAECYDDKAWDGNEGDMPAGTTPVPVSAGATASSVDAALADAGGISGVVTEAGGGAALAGVVVTVFDSTGNDIDEAETDSTGHYTVGPLYSGNYRVCFEGYQDQTTGGTSSTGYVDQCYNDVDWSAADEDDDQPPSGATPVAVTTGSVTPNVDATLVKGGAITGTVTDMVGGAPLGSVEVSVYTTAGVQAGYGETIYSGTRTGRYTVTGLAAGVSYVVCFDGRYLHGSSATGYLSQCYNSKTWTDPDNGTLPGGTTSVTVTSGSATTVDQALPHAGGIAGTVTATSGGAGLSDVDVLVFRSGDQVAGSTTAYDGSYVVGGLTTGSYKVCFDATNAHGGSAAYGYQSECYNDKVWNPQGGLPSGAASVPVTAPNTATANAALAADGAVSGTVTAANGTGLAGVRVQVITDPGDPYDAPSATTSATGAYTVGGLPPSSAGYTVCFDASAATGGPSTAGYRDECFNDKAWDGDPYDIPDSTTAVTVTSGAAHSGINASLAAGAAIGGTLTSSTGALLSGVHVQLFTDDPDFGYQFAAGLDDQTGGTYKITGLDPTQTYVACFDASQATGGTSATGYVSECYNDVPWVGDYPPDGVTALHVSAGSVTTANASFAVASAVAGTVTTTGGTGLGEVSVSVYDADGNQLYAFGAYTNDDGTYEIRGLAAGSYQVCFDGTDAQAGDGGDGVNYVSQCYSGKSWFRQSAPTGSPLVTTTAAHVTGGVDATLAEGGSISGTLTSSGDSLDEGDIAVYQPDGTLVGSAYTDSGSGGTYTVSGLPPSASGYVVCFSGYAASGGSVQPQCYDDADWSGDPSDLPADATRVPVSAGQDSDGIDAQLGPSPGIAGNVTDTDGDPLAADVTVYDASGDFAGEGYDDGDGLGYVVSGLTPAAGYTVCFTAFDGAHDSQCYDQQAWDGDQDNLPSGATKVTVSAGAVTGGVDGRLAASG